MIKPIADFYSSQTQRYLLGNSLTVKVGDAVVPGYDEDNKLSYVTNSDVTGADNILGVVVGFSKENGEIYPHYGQDPSLTPNQITTSATNLTSEKIYAVVLPITRDLEFEIDLNATAGTTDYSDQPLVYFSLADAGTVDESSASTSAGGEIISLGLIPGSNKKIRAKFVKGLLI
jgi:hypothetical protein